MHIGGQDRFHQQVAHSLGISLYHDIGAVAACSTGLSCVLAAANTIESGRTDWAVAGAADQSQRHSSWLALANSACSRGHNQRPRRRRDAALVSAAELGCWYSVAVPTLAAGAYAAAVSSVMPATKPPVGMPMSSSLSPTLVGKLPRARCHHHPWHRDRCWRCLRASWLRAGPWHRAERIAYKPQIGHCLGASGL